MTTGNESLFKKQISKLCDYPKLQTCLSNFSKEVIKISRTAIKWAYKIRNYNLEILGQKCNKQKNLWMNTQTWLASPWENVGVE